MLVTSAFLPFIQVVRTSFHISVEDNKAAIERKLKSGVEVLGLNAAETLPFLMALLGQEVDDPRFTNRGAHLIGSRTRNILLDLLWQSSRMAPVVMFLEDLHWMDSASEELLQRIIAADHDYSLLVVCAYRPPYEPPWVSSGNVSEVALEPLTRDGTVKLLSDRLGTTELSNELMQLVVEKAEGNPLFAEEIANYLQDQRQSEDTVLPANLQNLVMERFDRLDERSRLVLQAAAIVGRKFSSAIVTRVAQLSSATSEILSELESQHLILRIQDPNADYAFKHALVRDAIISTLMSSQSRNLHALVGDAVEEAYEGRLEEAADTLAHHFDLTDRHEKAVRYLIMAGCKSLQVFSLEEADKRFERAVELIEARSSQADHPLFGKAMSNWLQVLFWQVDFRRTIQVVEQRLEAVERISDEGEFARVAVYLGSGYVMTTRFDEGRRYLERALAIAERCSDDEAVSQACYGLMNLSNFRPGDMPTDYVPSLADRALEICEREEFVYNWTLVTFNMAWYHAIHGSLDETRQIGLRSIELGRRRGYAGAIGWGFVEIAYADAFSERFEDAIQHADEGVRLSAGPADRLVCLGIKGLAMAFAGQAPEGLALLRKVSREVFDNGYLEVATLTEVSIGTAMVLAGDMANGVRWIEDAIGRMQRWNSMHAAAIGRLVLGEIYLKIALGKDKPPPTVLLRNAFFLLRTIPFAKTKALQQFEEAARIGRDARLSGTIAQALMGMGVVHRASKRLPEAQRSLREAKAVAATIKWRFLNDKIDAELEALG